MVHNAKKGKSIMKKNFYIYGSIITAVSLLFLENITVTKANTFTYQTEEDFNTYKLPDKDENSNTYSYSDKDTDTATPAPHTPEPTEQILKPPKAKRTAASSITKPPTPLPASSSLAKKKRKQHSRHIAAKQTQTPKQTNEPKDKTDTYTFSKHFLHLSLNDSVSINSVFNVNLKETLTFYSTDSSVITVEDNIILPHKAGFAVIYLKTDDDCVLTACSVKISEVDNDE